MVETRDRARAHDSSSGKLRRTSEDLLSCIAQPPDDKLDRVIFRRIIMLKGRCTKMNDVQRITAEHALSSVSRRYDRRTDFESSL